MLKFLFTFIIFLPISLFSVSIYSVSPAICQVWVGGICIGREDVQNGSDFSRDGWYVGLYSKISVAQSDVGREFYFKVRNNISSDPIYESKYKIALDSKDCCPSDTGCTSGFPQGYALFKYYPYDKKWYNKKCLDSTIVEIFDDYISEQKFGDRCYYNDKRVFIGKYFIDFYEESQFLQNGDFWITPGFNEVDRIAIIEGVRYPRVENDGQRSNAIGNVSTPSSTTLNINEWCKDWEGGLASIANYTYYPIDGFSYSTGHQIHSGTPQTNSSGRDCPCHMGEFSQYSGNLTSNDGIHSDFTTTWYIPNTSGTYKFRVYLSKNFDGRIFATHNDYNKKLGFNNLTPLNGASGDGQMYLIKQCEAGDHHCTQENFYDRYIHPYSLIMLGAVFDKLLKRIREENPNLNGYMPVITAGSLERGGCFDMNGDYNCPHQKHRMGHNVDISLNLEDLLGNRKYYNILRDLNTVIENLYGRNSGSFCRIHNKNHYHCRFYNGWYNNLQ